jgi:hypothetical protein
MLRHTRILAFAIAALYGAALPSLSHAQCNWTSGEGTGTCTTLGSVGIGTTSPINLLDLVGTTGIIGAGGEAGSIGIATLQTSPASNYMFLGFDKNYPNGGYVQVSNPTLTLNEPLLLNPLGGNVGIGTTTPATALHIFDTVDNGGSVGNILVESTTNNAGLYLKDDQTGGRGFIMASSGGSASVPSSFRIIDLTAGIDRLDINNAGAIGIGTTDPCTNSQAPQNCKLSVAGAIQAYDVTVNNSWSDYVFDSGYRLAPLAEVAGYIKDHHHLPDIPATEEVQQKGVSVGDMQAKLLAKIEELTLHMIEAEKENRELRERIARLEARDSR